MTWPADEKVDLAYWNVRLLWRLSDAVSIDMGIDPRIFISEDHTGDGFDRRGPKGAMNQVKGYKQRLDEICTLAEAGAFPIIKGANAETPMFWSVKPSDYRKFIDGGHTTQQTLSETQQADMQPAEGDVAEMNSLRALAVMAWIMSENKSVYAIGGRPNASEIGKAIELLAAKFFGEDVRGLKAFHKKISRAIALLESQN